MLLKSSFKSNNGLPTGEYLISLKLTFCCKLHDMTNKTHDYVTKT